jgi:hypothetical protein
MNEQWQEDRNDDISKLFRDNEQQLEETPSLRAWNKLERKLDRRRTDKRKVIYRYTSMIAASIAVLAMIYTIGLLDKVSDTSKDMAKNTATDNLSEKSIAENESPIDLIEEEGILEMESGTETDYKKIIPNDNLNNSMPIAGNFSDNPIVEKKGSTTKTLADANLQKDNTLPSRSFAVKPNETVTDKNKDNKFEFPSIGLNSYPDKMEEVPTSVADDDVSESEDLGEIVVVESSVNAQGNPYRLKEDAPANNPSSKRTNAHRKRGKRKNG